MLEAEQRQLLLQALEPPIGYQLDRAIGTTYSLDLEALLFVPLAFTRYDLSDSGPIADPLALMEALRRHAGRLSVFCQAGQLDVPKGNRLLAHLEEAVVEVTAPTTGALFHPKVWIVRYAPAEPGGGAAKYRVLVMSRNLTSSTAWDVMVVLDGTLTSRQLAFAANHPLGDFVAALPTLAHDVPERVTSDVELVQDEIRRVRFEPLPSVDEIAFWPLGIPSYRRGPFPRRRDRSLVVAPFIGPQWLNSFVRESRHTVVVSREEELRKLEPEIVEAIGDCRYLGVPDPEAGPQSSTGEEQASTIESAGLHAKIFVIDAGWESQVWLGSANATDGAFHGNVEFLVELKGRRSAIGVEALVGSQDASRGFGQWLRPYSMTPDQGAPDPTEELRKTAEDLRVAVATLPLRATANPTASDPPTYDIAIRLSEGSSIPANVDIAIWPGSLGVGAARALVPGSTSVAEFTGLAVLDLTTFYGVRASRRDRADLEPVRFGINVPTEGLPADRPQRILRSLLDQPDRVMQYLLMLLTIPTDSDVGADGTTLDLALNIGQSGWDVGQAGLFEALLRILRRDPKRLREVSSFLRDLAAGTHGKAVLPPELVRLLAQVESAAGIQ